jgi:hypothetical protein
MGVARDVGGPACTGTFGMRPRVFACACVPVSVHECVRVCGRAQAHVRPHMHGHAGGRVLVSSHVRQVSLLIFPILSVLIFLWCSVRPPL